MKYDVFISYSRKDIDVANKFREVRKFKEFSEISGKTSNPKLLKLFKFPNLPITTHKSPFLPSHYVMKLVIFMGKKGG